MDPGSLSQAQTKPWMEKERPMSKWNKWIYDKVSSSLRDQNCPRTHYWGAGARLPPGAWIFYLIINFSGMYQSYRNCMCLCVLLLYLRAQLLERVNPCCNWFSSLLPLALLCQLQVKRVLQEAASNDATTPATSVLSTSRFGNSQEAGLWGQKSRGLQKIFFEPQFPHFKMGMIRAIFKD